MLLLLLKSQVKGYHRKDGTYVKPHSNKIVAKWHGATTKAPLDDSAYAKIGKPTVSPTVNVQHVAPKLKSAKVSENNSIALPKKNNNNWPYKNEYPSQASLFGNMQKKPHENAKPHPRLDEKGNLIYINSPSQPTDLSAWGEPNVMAVCVPDGILPSTLNGIEFKPWVDFPKTTEGWDFVDGQMPNLEEPDMITNGKAPAAGVVIEEPDGRVWLVSPTNGFAGYKTTFPKGHADDGISLQATAIKEAFEESGLKVAITGFIGDVERGQTMTRYYRAVRVGGTPTNMGWETQAVKLVPKSELHDSVNRDYDRNVATLSGIKPPHDLIPSADGWQKMGAQLGSNPGGIYQDENGQEWYVKIPKPLNVIKNYELAKKQSADIAKNEVLAAKLYESAGVKVPELKHVKLDGRLAIASKIIPNLKKLPVAGATKGVMDNFAVDCWLANWDVVGLLNDNLLSDENGDAVRVDVGGSLMYRAQGETKGDAFGKKVGELDTMTNGKNPQSADVFGNITHAELIEGIKKVTAVSHSTIDKLCKKYGPGSEKQEVDLAETLKARQAYLTAFLDSGNV